MNILIVKGNLCGDTKKQSGESQPQPRARTAKPPAGEPVAGDEPREHDDVSF